MTTPKGSKERPFDLVKLVKGAGADHVYRYTVYHAAPLQKTIKEALQHDEFYFIDVISSCPVQYGRRNEMREPLKMLHWIKDQSERYQGEDHADKMMIGIILRSCCCAEL